MKEGLGAFKVVKGLVGGGSDGRVRIVFRINIKSRIKSSTRAYPNCARFTVFPFPQNQNIKLNFILIFSLFKHLFTLSSLPFSLYSDEGSWLGSKHPQFFSHRAANFCRITPRAPLSKLLSCFDLFFNFQPIDCFILYFVLFLKIPINCLNLSYFCSNICYFSQTCDTQLSSLLKYYCQFANICATFQTYFT